MLPTVINDLQVQLVPALLWEKPLQILLRLGNAFSVCQFPSLGQAMNMGVHRKGGVAEGLGHHNRCRLVSDPGKFLQFIESGWYRTTVLIDQDPGQSMNSLRLPWSQTAWTDDFVDCLHRLPRHFQWIIGQRE